VVKYELLNNTTNITKHISVNVITRVSESKIICVVVSFEVTVHS